jgi:hypothetical protein
MEFVMPPPVKALTEFDVPLGAPLNVDVSIKDRSLKQAICGANGFEGEDKGLDYILYCKGPGMRLIPLPQVCLNVVLRPEWAAAKDGDGSPPRPRGSRLSADAVGVALESAGVIFVEENEEGPGVRLRQEPQGTEGLGK